MIAVAGAILAVIAMPAVVIGVKLMIIKSAFVRPMLPLVPFDENRWRLANNAERGAMVADVLGRKELPPTWKDVLGTAPRFHRMERHDVTNLLGTPDLASPVALTFGSGTGRPEYKTYQDGINYRIGHLQDYYGEKSLAFAFDDEGVVVGIGIVRGLESRPMGDRPARRPSPCEPINDPPHDSTADAANDESDSIDDIPVPSGPS